ncbi:MULTISPECIES: hypothetical protein [Bacillus]|jgi:uncharacterized membrane protein|uniref:hypothetical protein n=1 Tax=Bacillus TaxID=1386 RepID=UPI0007798202|nr:MULTISPECIES: hypothetical protein [Bacillus]KYC77498.1 hypothetical protein B4092_4731 [Bacillus licheniformis]MCY8151991.1 hypothetical protein [Bacillus paralicheniformis]MEC1050922.1 hypothetical protein [Bacillus paralicheniformis]MEC1085046.1 hypothetical protein [Bacillus paralicheniformis]MEC1108846.1 hypothetical protein [Bacillus paralicheniformis]
MTNKSLLLGLAAFAAFFLLYKFLFQLIGIGLLLFVVMISIYFVFRVLIGFIYLILVAGGIFFTLGLFVTFF